jgi:outer membrane protein OmpA-like peptidoglycan-associated protein
MLRDDTKEILDRLVDLLTRYPAMEIEIQGHTDSDGPAEANLALSQGRAETVVGYLVARGIAAGRLRAVGYGEASPIAPNTTTEGKQLNRRVMVKITDYGWHKEK